jgi:hypothetical protein
MSAMSTALHVVISQDSPSITHRVVLASLPERFAVSDESSRDASPEVVLVSTNHHNWPQHPAFVTSGLRAVMLTGPGAASTSAVENLMERRTASAPRVLVSHVFASDPTWTSIRPNVTSDAEQTSVIDTVVTVAKPELLLPALLEQLATLRSIVPSIGDDLALVHSGTRSYLLAGRARACAISLAGVVSPAGSSTMSLDVVGATRRWRVDWHAEPLAAPTTAVRADEHGTTSAPHRYESGHRRSWIELHTLLTDPSAAAATDPTGDLRALLADLRFLTKLGISLPPGS